MKKEYELVARPQLLAFHMLLVHLNSRTPHSHNELEIGLILNGEAEIVQNGNSRHLSSGDMYVLNPMELHSIHSDDDGALILAILLSRQMVTSFFLHDNNTYFVESCIRPFFTDHETRYEIMKGLFVELGFHYFSQLTNYEYKCMSLLNMLIYIINTYVPKQALSDADQLERIQQEARLARITDYIDENFRQKLLLQDIADREGLSLSYLSHFFTENYGMSFQDFLNKKRFEYACGLLWETDKNILNISIESGFSDVRYLNKLCRQTYGCTAAELRQQKAARPGSRPEITQSEQNIYTPGDSILLLNSMREDYHKRYSEYTIWDFFR